jgi:hypothetical protein
MVDVLDIALPKLLHETRASVAGSWSNKQVHVIRHQAIGMHRAIELGGKRLHKAQVRQVIGIRKETIVAVDSALNDVQRQTGNDTTRRTRHEAKTTTGLAGLTA